MADSITIEIISNEEIKSKYPYYDVFPLMKLLRESGKEVDLYKVDYVIDTSNATFTETTKPTVECVDFDNPLQLYLRSSNAADVDKEIEIIGQKSTGEFGSFNFSTVPAKTQGYQTFNATSDPIIVSGNYECKIKIDGSALDTGNDIVIALLEDDSLADIVSKMEAAITAIANTSEVSIDANGLIRLTSDAEGASSAVLIEEPTDGDSLITLLTSVNTPIAGIDGTEPVDIGEWNFASIANKVDAFAGNAIIDSDGESTIVYFTLSLGVSSSLGIVYVPKGYNGAAIKGYASLVAVPSAAANANLIKLGLNGTVGILNTYINNLSMEEKKVLDIAASEKDRISTYTTYSSAFTKTNIYLLFAVWK